MKSVVTHWKTEWPKGTVCPGGLVVIGDSGDDRVWKYCQLFQRAICEGAGVVAIAHGVDTKTNTDAAIVAYSNEEHFTIGKTLGECWQAERAARDPNCLTVALSRFCEVYGVEKGLERFYAGEKPP